MSDIKIYLEDLLKKVQKTSSSAVKEECMSELAYLIERAIYIRLENIGTVLSQTEILIREDIDLVKERETREAYFLCAVRIVEYKSFFQININKAFVEKLLSAAHSDEELVYVIQMLGMTRNKDYLPLLEKYKNSSVTEIEEAVHEALIELQA